MLEEKRSLRGEMRARVSALDPGARAAESAAVVARLRGVLPRGPVLLYAALGDEVHLDPLFDVVDLVLPRITEDGLVLHCVGDPAALVRGPLGIREPPAGWPRIAPDALALAVCPGRAFDPTGGRLGRGAAYYDRLLASGAPAWGVCFDCQVVDRVPREAHDRAMERVVTAGRVWTAT